MRTDDGKLIASLYLPISHVSEKGSGSEIRGFVAELCKGGQVTVSAV